MRDDLGGDLTDDAEHSLQMLTRSASLASDMVHGLVGISRMLTARTTPTDLRLEGLIQTCWDALAPGDGVQLSLSSLPTVRADRAQLTSLFSAVLLNYLEAGATHIDVWCRPATAGTCIVVDDDGRGIEASRFEHVMEPFSRLQGPPCTEHLGLGLALCRTVATRHHGSVAFEACPQGARLAVALGA